jgi:hypothetical protein
MNICKCIYIEQLINDPNEHGKYYENIVKINQLEE